MIEIKGNLSLFIVASIGLFLGHSGVATRRFWPKWKHRSSYLFCYVQTCSIGWDIDIHVLFSNGGIDQMTISEVVYLMEYIFILRFNPQNIDMDILIAHLHATLAQILWKIEFGKWPH